MLSRDIRPGVRRLFRLALRRPERAHAEMDDEIRLHLVLRTEQLMREGLSPEAARAEAERRFGSLETTRPRLHSSARRREDRMRMREWLDGVAHDIRIAIRGLRRRPGFVVTAVTCIALGVGANAATFSLADELLLRPLPVREPERLVNLASPGVSPGRENWGPAGPSEALFSHPMFRDLARAPAALSALSGIAAHRLFYANLAYHDTPVFGEGALVSGSYFPLLGLRPSLGRLLGPGDDMRAGASPVAVLSDRYWRTTLGADSAVLGRSILVNGHSLTVVGVAPPGFDGTTLGVRPRVFVPLAMAETIDPAFDPSTKADDRRWYWLYLFARLRPGVTLEQARSALNTAYRPILAEVEAPLLKGVSATTRARFLARSITLDDGRHGQSTLRGNARMPLLLLFAITALVVLIASANVANLLLARAATRTTEMAVRLALGAGRRRMLRLLLAESCLLALLGGAASLLVAYATLAGVAALIPPAEAGSGASLTIALRPSALLFAAAVSLGTGLLFGLFPALHGTRSDLVTAIRAQAGQASGARRAARFRAALVTAQMALSMALLIASGLLITSLRNVNRLDLGLAPDRVLTFGLAPMLNGYEPARSRALFERVEEALAATPGVTSVAGSSVGLFTGTTRGGDVRIEGVRRDADSDANTRLNEVGPGYFRTLGIPLRAGRELTPADRLGAPRAAIVNEAFARKFGLGSDVIGRRMALDGDSPSGALDIEIVGLVHDTRYNGVKEPEPPIVYTAYRQDPTIGGLFFYARTSGDPEAMLGTVRRIVAQLDPTLPVVMLKTMRQQVRENIYLDRVVGTLSAAFAALATLLAAVGLYGVLAYTVAQRTREIGVRIALGADPRHVRGLVLRQVGRMTAVGGAVGIAAALAFGQVAQSLLFGLTSRDPRVVVAAAVVLTAVALGAGFVPAWRASRIAPGSALRAE